jgi:hypothetical protein
MEYIATGMELSEESDIEGEAAMVAVSSEATFSQRSTPTVAAENSGRVLP